MHASTPIVVLAYVIAVVAFAAAIHLRVRRAGHDLADRDAPPHHRST